MRRKRLAATACAITLSLSTVVPVFACTPKLNTPSVKIPEIHPIHPTLNPLSD